MRVEKVALASPLVQRLIARLNEELSATYPEEGATHFRLEPDEVASGRGAFVVPEAGGYNGRWRSTLEGT